MSLRYGDPGYFALIVHARLQLQAPGIHTEISNTNAHKEAILSFSVLLISVLPELQPN